jgi:hypothetical protein
MAPVSENGEHSFSIAGSATFASAAWAMSTSVPAMIFQCTRIGLCR